ncbi:MAG TPA: biotin/lipoyl-containing protein, partial [Acidimicrobiales bacterium]|nr:biotin/lipoyl-containing protein [Acidimicrobiales bacterium]
MADITMPQLGETVTEGTITKWMKKVGDPIEEDEVLFEVSTDKVDSEVPSPAAGVVSEILVEEGETVDVGTKLAVISPAGTQTAPATPSEQKPEVADNGSGAAEARAAEDEESAGELQPQPESVSAPPAPEPVSATSSPPARPAPTGSAAPPAPAASAAPAAPAARVEPPPAQGESSDDGGSRLLSPVVRKLVAEHNLDPAEIRGTGPGGRITRGDVLSLIDQRNGGTRAGARVAQAAPQAPAGTGA